MSFSRLAGAEDDHDSVTSTLGALRGTHASGGTQNEGHPPHPRLWRHSGTQHEGLRADGLGPRRPPTGAGGPRSLRPSWRDEGQAIDPRWQPAECALICRPAMGSEGRRAPSPGGRNF